MFRLHKILQTDAPTAVWLPRLAVGLVFLSEGIQKFLYPDTRGTGRFADIGLPNPEVLGPLVGGLETLCGALLVLGLLTRPAAIPLITIMLVAIASTKIPILAQEGFWAMAHAARTDFLLLTTLFFLLTVGAGRFSVDYSLATRSA